MCLYQIKDTLVYAWRKIWTRQEQKIQSLSTVLNHGPTHVTCVQVFDVKLASALKVNVWRALCFRVWCLCIQKSVCVGVCSEFVSLRLKVCVCVFRFKLTGIQFSVREYSARSVRLALLCFGSQASMTTSLHDPSVFTFPVIDNRDATCHSVTVQ